MRGKVSAAAPAQKARRSTSNIYFRRHTWEEQRRPPGIPTEELPSGRRKDNYGCEYMARIPPFILGQ